LCWTRCNFFCVELAATKSIAGSGYFPCLLIAMRLQHQPVFRLSGVSPVGHITTNVWHMTYFLDLKLFAGLFSSNRRIVQ
jgi:hypothetical protein